MSAAGVLQPTLAGEMVKTCADQQVNISQLVRAIALRDRLMICVYFKEYSALPGILRAMGQLDASRFIAPILALRTC